jgi:hypothetical protein
MKLIADIGTNPELIKIDVTDVLLHHFLKHYDSIGVTEFILHGNDEVINTIKPIYENRYNIKFIYINSEKFYEYKNRDWSMYNDLKAAGKVKDYHHPPANPNTCPLWIIQNDLKKQHITDNELCFILDLDEFVELSSLELRLIQESDIHFCRGVLRDRIGESNGELITLNKQIDIFEQLNQTVDITKGLANRATQKVIITRGHLEHCHGHHCLYNRADLPKKNWSSVLTVDHCKYFKQNIEGGLGPHGIREQAYFNDLYDK